ncbi:thioesterase [Anabaena cylindrica FACHB-243]|uniref:Oleoyl-(Acyl-carrier-protein) hydrolase n=1 Tax=Anabaena cylindrica (strain ATCC 27899 / PCC 7122) TaxID=272123 RepID=K9ZQ97_ANACC|nr:MULTISPECIES: thioesterase II family protein [Anabaena]AFZ60697.1 Oleoyl-(acyl-carrier-protein) hydrolase [Anabaena cylindrica PCC 7122]MBD2419522.1 thioesterase [Anabaena cylindrica FACHB-243]MBY5282220.1 thioesterase [Anabaena sp. CCAP 1446/1C]MBY5309117.1 thioesterase [Anabaena sp. CCAP 1446/1C]MCM2409716.1 thioesterase II family protein [Anabaena sp. CCAP 1446/1C]
MKVKTTFNSWVTCPQPNPQAKLRLFCLPYAGGSAMVFRTWANDLPPTIEVCPLELPGRGRQMNLPPYTEMKPLVREIAQNLIPYLDKPFAFFGHSMGGLVSFELTRLLRSDYNLTPSHLFISARSAPQVPPTKRPIYNLPDAEFWQEVLSFNGTPDDIVDNPDIIQIFLPILRADFTVLDTYIYNHQSPFDFPISVFGGLQDPEFTDYELEAWREQTTAPFLLQMIDGNHFFISSNQKVLLKSISQQLE